MRMDRELIEKAKWAKCPEEIVAMSRQCGVEITLAEAKGYYNMLQGGELSDDELDAVAGGGCGGDNNGADVDKKCPQCGGALRVTSDGMGNFSTYSYYICDVCGYKERK